ncbi:10323_t:CDS:2 [Cetraspora pellucida]|uniref:10323_t:CDS:1 n=1 Tax=Cetraspora pellucida TaxID=1433469 RepID=A0ACA9JWE1_9GLOM|nr:10323_t:CDS:2 [Cetraspora pellucida]
MWYFTSEYYPFSNRNYDEYLIKEICEKIHLLYPKVLEDTPPDYEKLIRKCWDEDPNKHPTTKDQFITGNSEVSAKTFTFNSDQFSSKLMTVKVIKDPILKDDKIVNRNLSDSNNN